MDNGGRVVVDASLALKWVLDEPHSGEAQQLLDLWVRRRVIVMAPTLLAFEAANILYQRARRGQLTVEAAGEALAALMGTHLTLMGGDEPDLADQALKLAEAYRLPATYDAAYMGLALRWDCPLWTADERLWNQVHPRAPWVRRVGEVEQGPPTC
ncbi:MAG: type II toxin-antitoxin system VapC family toxin [Firmicutes bacterium]|nr:type II toxin-antitoxin system VapC family toxin [Alicyclobacillaceae bacterium]MCL6498171.1 type II toxin-antitoxin system VapC family toxin [Bacillota bacterium]